MTAYFSQRRYLYHILLIFSYFAFVINSYRLQLIFVFSYGAQNWSFQDPIAANKVEKLYCSQFWKPPLLIKSNNTFNSIILLFNFSRHIYILFPRVTVKSTVTRITVVIISTAIAAVWAVALNVWKWAHTWRTRHKYVGSRTLPFFLTSIVVPQYGEKRNDNFPVKYIN